MNRQDIDFDSNEFREKYKLLFDRYDGKKIAKYSHFRETNSHVYEAFVSLAKRYRDAGRTLCSAVLLGNVLRWHSDIGELEGNYKIQNDWLPMMARELVVTDPSFTGFFAFRD
jgi:hypothetical protein